MRPRAPSTPAARGTSRGPSAGSKRTSNRAAAAALEWPQIRARDREAAVGEREARRPSRTASAREGVVVERAVVQGSAPMRTSVLGAAPASPSAPRRRSRCRACSRTPAPVGAARVRGLVRRVVEHVSESNRSTGVKIVCYCRRCGSASSSPRRRRRSAWAAVGSRSRSPSRRRSWSSRRAASRCRRTRAPVARP